MNKINKVDKNTIKEQVPENIDQGLTFDEKNKIYLYQLEQKESKLKKQRKEQEKKKYESEKLTSP